jgi:hypothetical protein
MECSCGLSIITVYSGILCDAHASINSGIITDKPGNTLGCTYINLGIVIASLGILGIITAN